ncbi:MAG: methyltransferase [Bacillota bacterium]|nr:methyltransferase [Bacillota bacterium]
MQFEVEIWQHRLSLTTYPALFSPRGPDAGTMALLQQIELMPEDRVLDLGCGYGLIGLAVAKKLGARSVVMVDIDPVAVAAARHNAEQNDCGDVTIVLGDGPAAALGLTFSLILCNPPYHTDFSVARRLIEQSYRQLETNGRLCLVVKRLDWYRNKLASLFGGVMVKPVGGYFVLTAIRRNQSTEVQVADLKKDQKMTKKHARRIKESQRRHHHSGH